MICSRPVRIWSSCRTRAACTGAVAQAVLRRTAFHNRIAQVYQEGAGLVVAANLERLIEKAKPESDEGRGWRASVKKR